MMRPVPSSDGRRYHSGRQGVRRRGTSEDADSVDRGSLLKMLFFCAVGKDGLMMPAGFEIRTIGRAAIFLHPVAHLRKRGA